MKGINPLIKMSKAFLFNRIILKAFSNGKSQKFNKKTEGSIMIDISNDKTNLKNNKIKANNFIVDLGNDSNEHYFIEQSRFDSNGKLLITKVDSQQKYLLSIVCSGIILLSLFFYTRYNKANKKPKTTRTNIYKYFCLGLSILSLYCLILFTKRINTFITKIFLMNDGRTIEICSYFKKFRIDIKDFNLLNPNDETYLTKQQYSQLYTEGFPIRINKSIYVLSKSSVVYEKSILGKIGTKQYLDVI